MNQNNQEKKKRLIFKNKNKVSLKYFYLTFRMEPISLFLSYLGPEKLLLQCRVVRRTIALFRGWQCEQVLLFPGASVEGATGSVPRLASNSLPSAGVAGMSHHVWLIVSFLKERRVCVEMCVVIRENVVRQCHADRRKSALHI